MSKKRRDLEIFSLSFLDIISCGFGAVVLLVLISTYGESPLSDIENDAESLLQQVLRAEALEKELEIHTRGGSAGSCRQGDPAPEPHAIVR